MQQKQPRIVALACIALLLLGACAPARAQATLTDVKANFGRPPEPPAKSIVETATLRDVGIRGPYMHDGSIPSLDAVIDHYNGHYTRRASLDPDMRSPEFDRAESAAPGQTAGTALE